MKLRSILVMALFALVGAALRAEAPAGVAGQWKLDVKRSSPIRPWDTLTVEIKADADGATITRHLTWGADRKADDVTAFKTDGKTETSNAVTYWLDTWYTNLYIGGDHHKRVTGEWLDGGRVLKVETNLQIEGQQGDHPVHLYHEYRLSADGRTLKLYELRSTRDEPLVYFFTRA